MDPRGRRQALTNATPPGGQERWPGETAGDSGQRAGCFHAETRTPHQAERPGSVRHTTPGLLSASELSPASSLDTHMPRGPQTRRALGAESCGLRGRPRSCLLARAREPRGEGRGRSVPVHRERLREEWAKWFLCLSPPLPSTARGTPSSISAASGRPAYPQGSSPWSGGTLIFVHTRVCV